MTEPIRPELLVARLAAPQESWRVDAELKLVGLGATAVPLLIGALHHASPAVRLHAVSALARIGDPSAVQAVVAALGDTENNGAVAIAAEKALVGWGEPVKPAVLDAARTAMPHVRARAVRTLGKLGGRDLTSHLATLLHDSVPAVRSQAAVALAAIDGEAAAERIAPLLTDREKWVRYEVAEALVHAGSVAGEAVLREAMADPEEASSHVPYWAEDLLDAIEDLKRKLP